MFNQICKLYKKGNFTVRLLATCIVDYVDPTVVISFYFITFASAIFVFICTFIFYSIRFDRPHVFDLSSNAFLFLSILNIVPKSHEQLLHLSHPFA